MPVVRREYKRSDTPKGTLQSESAAYLTKRGITKETSDAFGVYQDDKGNMVLPFYRTQDEFTAKDATFVKFRKPRKIAKGERKMWREPGTEPILFGMHLCDTETPILYIHEGEFDAMCSYQVGAKNCVSVPSGCEDFTWLETCHDWLRQFTLVVVMADNDDAGRKMLNELSIKLDCEVRRPNFDDYAGCKDTNEILLLKGPEQLAKAIIGVQPIETVGLLNLADVKAIDLDNVPRTLTRIPTLDKITNGLLDGEVSVWTGKRGEGKSTVLTQILLEAIDQDVSVCAYSGEIPAERFKYAVNLQAAGSAFAQERTDEATGRTVQYVPPEYVEQMEAWYNGKFWLYDNKVVERDEGDTVIRLFELAYKRYNCRVFLVDNLMTVSSCRKESDYFQMQGDFTIQLGKLAKKLGVHIHLVAHPRKGDVKDSDSVGGLSTITNAADNVFSMKRIPDTEIGSMGCNATITCLKNRNWGEQTAVKLNYIPRCRRYLEVGGTEHELGWSKDVFTEVSAQDAPF